MHYISLGYTKRINWMLVTITEHQSTTHMDKGTLVCWCAGVVKYFIFPIKIWDQLQGLGIMNQWYYH